MKDFLGFSIALCFAVTLVGVLYKPAIQQLCWNDCIDDSTAENLVDTFNHIYGR